MATITAPTTQVKSRILPTWLASGKWLVHFILISVAVIWLVPTIGLLITSIRPPADIAQSGWWTVLSQPHLTTENYQAVLGAQGMGTAFLNSFKITIPSTILLLVVASLAAYSLAWIEFRGRGLVFLFVIAAMVVPIQTTLVPVLKLYNQLGLQGTYVGIWIAHTGYGLPFAIYLLRNFFVSLPKELLESARIDGASELTTFFRIIVPLSVAALASLAIFQFMWVWNDLLVALVLMSGPATAPVTVRMQAMLGTYATEWHIMSASAFISMAVPLAVFFLLQRYFVTGITAGAVKS